MLEHPNRRKPNEEETTMFFFFACLAPISTDETGGVFLLRYLQRSPWERPGAGACLLCLLASFLPIPLVCVQLEFRSDHVSPAAALLQDGVSGTTKKKGKKKKKKGPIQDARAYGLRTSRNRRGGKEVTDTAKLLLSSFLLEAVRMAVASRPPSQWLYVHPRSYAQVYV